MANSRNVVSKRDTTNSRKAKSVEPVYINRFALEFNLKGSKIKLFTSLNEQAISINYDEIKVGAEWGLDIENLHIEFNQYIHKRKIQPITVLEKLMKLKAELDITLSLLDKKGHVLRKVDFLACTIKSIKGLKSFAVYAGEAEKALSVGLFYKKIKTR